MYRLNLKIVAIAIFVESCLVLLGWQYNISFLKSLLPGLVPMNPLTAIVFLVLAIALWSLKDRTNFFSAQIFLAGFIFIAGLLKIKDVIFNTHITPDNILFAHELYGNQMALNTALGFSLVGVILLLIATKRWIKAAHFLTFIVFIIAWVSLLGYLYGSNALYSMWQSSPMSLPSVVLFIAASVGIFCIRPHEGLLTHLTSHTTSGRMARILLPCSILIPSMIGWVKVHIGDRFLLDFSTGTAFSAIENGALFFILIWISTYVMSNIERTSKDNERELEKSKEWLAAIVDNSEDAIISKDLNGIITSWNNGAQKIFGYTSKEMVGQSIVVLIPKDGQKEENSILSRLQRGERLEHYETIRQRKDGSLVDISLTVSPIKDSKGRIIGASKIARDISDRKKMEKALIRSNNELEEFAHVAAHDLQEPLHLIASFVTLFVKNYQDQLDDKAKEYLKYIQQASSQAKSLIKDLLEYSSVGKGNSSENISLRDVMKEVKNNLKISIEESNAQIKYNGLPDIKGRRSEWVQLFQNLISNAIKYRKETPYIEISVSRAFDGRSFLFSFKDNGIGIDPDCKERIFNMFERLHNGSEYSGTGIGLAVCKKIVERHGGKIWVDSTPGKGSTFFIALPLDPQSLSF